MLKEIIKASGERQAVWAERIGISEPHLSSLLSGKRKPSLALAGRIERLTDGRVSALSWHGPVDGSQPGAGLGGCGVGASASSCSSALSATPGPIPQENEVSDG